MSSAKPLSGYLLFARDYRSQHATEVKGVSAGQVAKLVAEKWRALSEGEKNKYQRRSKEMKASYAAVDVEDESKKRKRSDVIDSKTVLPLASVRRIVKADQEVGNITKEALVMITKCTEMFLETFTQRVCIIAKAHGKKTVDMGFVSHAIHSRKDMEFLRKTFPRALNVSNSTQPSENTAKKPAKKSHSGDKPVSGIKSITSFFTIKESVKHVLDPAEESDVESNFEIPNEVEEPTGNNCEANDLQNMENLHTDLNEITAEEQL